MHKNFITIVLASICIIEGIYIIQQNCKTKESVPSRHTFYRAAAESGTESDCWALRNLFSAIGELELCSYYSACVSQDQRDQMLTLLEKPSPVAFMIKSPKKTTVIVYGAANYVEVSKKQFASLGDDFIGTVIENSNNCVDAWKVGSQNAMNLPRKSNCDMLISVNGRPWASLAEGANLNESCDTLLKRCHLLFTRHYNLDGLISQMKNELRRIGFE